VARDAPISFRIEPELKEALMGLAKAERRSLSGYIMLVLEEHVQARKPAKPRRRPAPSP
jgi:hypothetical protein